jgi:hypothetical protein
LPLRTSAALGVIPVWVTKKAAPAVRCQQQVVGLVAELRLTQRIARQIRRMAGPFWARRAAQGLLLLPAREDIPTHHPAVRAAV